MSVTIDHEDAMTTFEDMFGPTITPSSDEIEYFDDHAEAVEAAKNLNKEEPLLHFWTITEEDGEMWVCEGNRFVNRMHMWLVTTKPHGFEGNAFLWYRHEEEEE